MDEKEQAVSALGKVIPVEDAKAIVNQSIEWVNTHLLTFGVAAQVIAIIAALVPAALFGPKMRNFLHKQVMARTPEGVLRTIVLSLAKLAIPIALYVTLTVFKIGFGSVGLDVSWISGAIALLNAWIAVRLVTLIIQSPFWSKVAFYIAWPIAALDAFGALAPVVDQLQALAIPLGQDDSGNDIKITLLDLVRTLLYFGLLFWGASVVGKIAEQQINQIDELSPSLKALINKLLSVVLPIVALLIALQIVGFNLATLAVFSGAVGLGIGLGLQRIIANFVAGFTLIADKSIKPNDTIEIDGTIGWVTSMQARYVALKTQEGTEHLIPNDRFMSEGVINWSRSDYVVRQHAGFGITYNAENLREVQKLAIEAAAKVGRVMSNPPPKCNLVEFGDNSVNFDVCYWISDPQNGLANVKSEVLLNIWDMLKEQGIEIPFPQRDLHIRSWSPEAQALFEKPTRADV